MSERRPCWTAEIDSGRIKVRAGLGTGRKIGRTLENDVQVRIIGRHGDWLLVVRPPASTGPESWIHKSLVSSAGR